MDIIISKPAVKDLRPLVYNMVPAALSKVPFHADTEAIIRYIAKAFPMHMAVHQVSPVYIAPPLYTTPHVHEDCDEINIIISSQRLIYQVLLGDKEYIVHNNTAIWIPRGTLHAANVLNGSGFFIAIRVNG
ncbi:MAG TPA: hypothetical protein VL307_00150 [Chitinophagaceae bacterium]|nr:hypothetical protein [Chitinophagaceae bacterium]